MKAVSVIRDWPAAGHPFTVADLDRMPDDGRRYELLDGTLVVSARPGTPHQLAATRLAALLTNSCPDGLYVIAEPAVQLSATTEFDPDIVVVGEDQIGAAKVTEPPVLIVEVRSPSTALIDLNRKKAAYERFGVPSYWIVVPHPAAPEVIAFELRGGSYAEAGRVSGDTALRATRPFPVEVVPAHLVAGLPPG